MTTPEFPALVMGDLEAQIASAELGVRRFEELLEKYGKDDVIASCNQLMDYTERLMRREIAKIRMVNILPKAF